MNEAPDFGRQLLETLYSVLQIFYSILPPCIFSIIGRAGHYANIQRMPKWKETPREAGIIIFMGAITGGAGDYFGLSGSALGALSASCAFFGPRILYSIAGAVLKKAGIDAKLSHPEDCNLDLNLNRKQNIDPEVKKTLQQAAEIFKGPHK